MRIQHNISAINSKRIISTTQGTMSKNLEKLSSGYRINRAGDDAAGLAVSEKMRAQITTLNQARRNTQDGVSLVQTVEGALTEVHSMLNRMKGMAVQASNSTYTDEQRSMMNEEMDALKEEIGRIGTSTNFSGVPLFANGGTKRGVTLTSVYGYTLDLNNKTVRTNYQSRIGQASESTGYDALADKIATEYIPNAVTQILDTFSSLKNNIGSDQIEMELRIEYIDGGYGTLAYAQASFGPSGRPFNMKITIDTADFSDASIQEGSSAEEALKSTIAHELMHSVMQYTMPDHMFGRGSTEKLPEWFVEGTAQLAGGGFPTGWNSALEQIAGQLTGEGDNTGDGAISNYLKSYDVKDRPYGHGYLAAAYIGYLANGGTGDIEADTIAAGMDKIYDDLINSNDSFYDILSKHTNGKITSQASLEALFDDPVDSDLTEFVRKLSVASKGGAGSIIAPSLSTGGSSIIGDSVTSDAPFYIGSWSVGAAGRISLLIGEADNLVNIDLFRLDSTGLRLSGATLLTQEDANKTIDSVDAAINQVSKMRSHYGAIQNRLEHTLSNLGCTIENLTAAESQIRDTDMALAVTEHVRNQILLQSGQSMLAQANQVPQSIISLLS